MGEILHEFEGLILSSHPQSQLVDPLTRVTNFCVCEICEKSLLNKSATGNPPKYALANDLFRGTCTLPKLNDASTTCFPVLFPYLLIEIEAICRE